MQVKTRGTLGTGLAATRYTIRSLIVTSQREVAITVEWEIEDRLGRHTLVADVILTGPSHDEARTQAVNVDGQPVANAADATARGLAHHYDEQTYVPENTAREAFVAAVESVMPDIWVGRPTASDEADPSYDPDYAHAKEFDWSRAVTSLVGRVIALSSPAPRIPFSGRTADWTLTPSDTSTGCLERLDGPGELVLKLVEAQLPSPPGCQALQPGDSDGTRLPNIEVVHHRPDCDGTGIPT